MKPGIHPTWYPEAVITCGACGTVYVTGSTKKEIHTDVCSNCHPFFTGEQRIIDTAGQVERFMKRQGAKDKIAATRPVAEEKPAKKEKGRDEKPVTKPVITPAELPLAMIEEKPAVPVVAQPAMRFGVPQPEPVAETKPVTPVPVPVAPVPAMPAPAPVMAPAPMAMPTPAKAAASRKPAAKKPAAALRKAPAKKPAAKKVAAPKAKAKPKASAAASRKPAAKKPAAKKKK